jgi:penicillin-binding protein 1B
VALKLKIPKRGAARGKRKQPALSLGRPAVKLALAAFVVVFLAGAGLFAYYYVRYDRIVDKRLRGPLFSNTAKIYARPESVSVGEKIAPEQIASELRHAGYTPDGTKEQSKVGTYRLLTGGIEILPGPQSYHSPDGAVVRVSEGQVGQIVGEGANNGQSLTAYELEPQLVTALSDNDQRAKRQLIKFQDIPKVLVDAVLAIEDRSFYQHGGLSYLGLLRAAWVDLRERTLTHGQGGSTITMQVSRMFFLTPEKTVKRKLTEMLIAIELEQKASKQQIFELYANQVPMGQRGSFTILGFAEAARAYFNKDLQSLTLPEAALLAGIIQRPSYLSPYRHPERALDRRNLVLDSMVETGAISRDEAERAKAAPLKLAPLNVEASDAPYFVDLVKDALSSRYSERDLNDQAYRIYTTLDPDLQRAAAEAVQIGLKEVDDQVRKLRTRRVKVDKNKFETKVLPGPEAQVALVAMDPHTGEVLALVGGRNYGISQLDHALANRPTGSVFKPFVYAAAVNTALAGGDNVLTPASMVDDSPTTFSYGDQIYEPRNYKDEYHGLVTARFALAHSLNNATVKLAEQVGYDKVADLARAAGIKSVQPTPAMALGAYEARPLDVASAYTVFANNGIRVSPVMVTSVRNAQGDPLDEFHPQTAEVLDPRVAYVMTSMMEGVINSGTAVTVRARGFSAPAAGKTGTSHDGWFAGYTSNLLCIVWVGFDDYSDLRLSGATTAAPIWAEFMKRAVALPDYADTKPFPQPDGVIDVQLDKTTNLLATAACPDTYTEAFVAGTEPKQTCDQAGGDHRNIFSRILGLGSRPPAPPPVTAQRPNFRPPQKPAPAVANASPAPPPKPADQEKKKKGFWGKVVGIFKGDKDEQPPPNQNRPR